ncbi:hypothetical protein X943_002960 [Babesia divergens]|uniref:MIP18 family-like domain-containing protein n=1 Tax=Babesia divergens TaxID=32595 RepID=A0AAD9G7F7_BABDI|nr:hypothetical protein X943_002960 [Babesia divergens]
MDNTNPVLYKSSSSLSTTQSDKRLLDDKRGATLFHIHKAIGFNATVESSEGTSPTKGLFHPTTEFQPFEASEIFDIIRNIKDPEYSYTLEALKIVEEENIHIDNDNSIVTVHFTPTVPHCSQVRITVESEVTELQATIIGLMIYVKLYQSLPPHYKIDVQITEGRYIFTWKQSYVSAGSHNNEHTINKQLLDKERVTAALENPVLLEMINDGIYHVDGMEDALITI